MTEVESLTLSKRESCVQAFLHNFWLSRLVYICRKSRNEKWRARNSWWHCLSLLSKLCWKQMLLGFFSLYKFVISSLLTKQHSLVTPWDIGVQWPRLKSQLSKSKDGGRVGRCGVHLSPWIDTSGIHLQTQKCMQSGQEYLISRKEYIEPCKTL